MKETVKNKVVTALLQAYHDTLDYDGMKSILNEAGLLELKNTRDIDPNKTIKFSSFKKIIDAQNLLLFNCHNLLYEIGKKFSFYLFPFGKNFEEIIQEINNLIRTDWKVEIFDSTENIIKIRVRNCVFVTESGQSYLFKGFIVHALEKTLTSSSTVNYYKQEVEDPTQKNYVLELKIERKK